MQRTEKQPLRSELPSGEASEGVTLWLALGFPVLTLICWIAGMMLLHPWIGFISGVLVSLVIAKRLSGK